MPILGRGVIASPSLPLLVSHYRLFVAAGATQAYPAPPQPVAPPSLTPLVPRTLLSRAPAKRSVDLSFAQKSLTTTTHNPWHHITHTLTP